MIKIDSSIAHLIIRDHVPNRPAVGNNCYFIKQIRIRLKIGHSNLSQARGVSNARPQNTSRNKSVFCPDNLVIWELIAFFASGPFSQQVRGLKALHPWKCHGDVAVLLWPITLAFFFASFNGSSTYQWVMGICKVNGSFIFFLTSLEVKVPSRCDCPPFFSFQKKIIFSGRSVLSYWNQINFKIFSNDTKKWWSVGSKSGSFGDWGK